MSESTTLPIQQTSATREESKLSQAQVPSQSMNDDGDEIRIFGEDNKLSSPNDMNSIARSGGVYPIQVKNFMRKSSDDTSFISQPSYSAKPVVKFETTLSVNIYQIKEVFERACKKRGFEIVDDEGDQVTAVNKKMISLKDMILSCIPGSSKGYQSLTAIRLQSKTNKVTCIRRITLKALLGDNKKANAFFADFEKELTAYNGKRAPGSPRLNASIIDNILSTNPGHKDKGYSPMRDDLNQDLDENVISAQNLESSSFYEFRKILSSEAYTIGKKVSEFTRDFSINYRSTQESAELLPQPMESVYLLVNEVTETFFADFNYGKSETKQIMPYCKMSVEKFIFDKVFVQLFGMYQFKYVEPTLKFENKVVKINENGDIIKQFKYLDIPTKFWLIPASNLDEENNLREPIERDDSPYIDAINEISKINKLKSPREKLGTLLMMHSLMKSAVVDFHRGKEEVCSMDEELPLMIFILIHAKLDNLAAELNFVDDYVQYDPTLESEKRLMTNIKVSVQYIADEWELN